MRKNTKELYIIEVIMFIVFLLFQVISKYFFSQYFEVLFYFLFFLVFFIRYGKPRNKNFINKICVRYLIILLLSYFIVVYLLGLFTGFLKSAYSLELRGIVGNVLPVFFMVLFKEYIRYIVAYRSAKKIRPLVVLTLLYIIFDLLININGSELNSFYQVFTFVCVTLLPLIARNLLSSYMAYHVGLLPNLLYNFAFLAAPFVLPIYPDLGNYLNAVIGILFPTVVYLTLKKWIGYKDKDQIRLGFTFVKLIGIPVFLFLIILAILISGVLKYQLIAIASDSMNPVYQRGDAIIYEKKDAQDVKEGDILVFEFQDTIVTHRVVRIVHLGNQIYFQTKGDNNDSVDATLIQSNQVLGTVKYIVKYIGYPTVWLSETF